MTATTTQPTIDNDRLMEFVGQFAGDLGATVAAGNVVLGDRLGLYQALATGAASASELAERTGTNARYVTEWVRGQAAGGYVEYDADTDTYSLTAEKAFALTRGLTQTIRCARRRRRCISCSISSGSPRSQPSERTTTTAPRAIPRRP